MISDYYPSNSQQIQTPNLPTNTPGGRNNSTTLMGPQGTTPTPTAPAASLSHPQPPAHMHQSMAGKLINIQCLILRDFNFLLPIDNLSQILFDIIH